MTHSILIIDDEEPIRRSLRRSLRREGYDIHCVESGFEGLRILDERDIAVVICDQRMPGMSGAEFLSESVGLSPETYRITLTGHTDLASAQRSINEGRVQRFMLKPWDDEELRRAVSEGVKSFELVQENRRLQRVTEDQNKKLEAWSQELERLVDDRTSELESQNAELDVLQQRFERSLHGTVTVLAGMMEVLAPSLGLHCKRVARCAESLGRHLQLDKKALLDIEFAALLHEIGRVVGATNSKPAQIGLRSGDPEELVQQAESGAGILGEIEGFEDVALSVRCLCERFDGHGPQGLVGEQIPLASRIVAVADAFDSAVVSPANPTEPDFENGRKRLQDAAEKEFDPELVKHFLEAGAETTRPIYQDTEIQISPRQVEAGMELARDLHSPDGILLLKAGTQLTPQLVDRVAALSKGNLLLTGIVVRCGRRKRPAAGGSRIG